MKNVTNQTGGQNRKGNSQKPRPEIRDNLDSRQNEEQDFKGDDTTHNKKETHGEPKKKNSKKS